MWGGGLSVNNLLIGPLGRVFVFERPNNRRPAEKFLKSLNTKDRKKFNGSFDALTKMGALYRNDQRFKALRDKGKPLWVFKEFDHRIYCLRTVCDGNKIVEVILLHGWTKDKTKGKQETREIETAQNLRSEYKGGV